MLRTAGCAAGLLCLSFATVQAAPISDYFPDGGSAASLPDIDTSLGTGNSTGTVEYDYDATTQIGTLRVDVDSGAFGFEFNYNDTTSPGTLTNANFLIADAPGGTGRASFNGAGGYDPSLSGDAVQGSPDPVSGYFEITGTPDADLASFLSAGANDPILTGTLVAVGTTNSGSGGNGVGEFIWSVTGGRAQSLFGSYVYTLATGSSGAQLDWTAPSNISLSYSAPDVINFDNTPGQIVPVPPALPMLGTAIAALLLWRRRRPG